MFIQLDRRAANPAGWWNITKDSLEGASVTLYSSGLMITMAFKYGATKFFRLVHVCSRYSLCPCRRRYVPPISQFGLGQTRPPPLCPPHQLHFEETPPGIYNLKKSTLEWTDDFIVLC